MLQQVVISRAEVTCEQGCITLLDLAAKKLGPVAAIFNLAVVLRDALFENQVKYLQWLPKEVILYVFY
jgi:fatty acid synthase, animal type